MYVYMYIYIYIYTCMCIYIYTHTQNIYIYIYIYIHTLCIVYTPVTLGLGQAPRRPLAEVTSAFSIIITITITIIIITTIVNINITIIKYLLYTLCYILYATYVCPCGQPCGTPTVSFHNFKSQNVKLSVSNPKIEYVAYVSVLSQISNSQGLGRKINFEILKAYRKP